MLTSRCNECNRNSSYDKAHPLIGSRFAGNAWIVTDSVTGDDQVYVYGGWGIDSTQTETYLSDLWMLNTLSSL